MITALRFIHRRVGGSHLSTGAVCFGLLFAATAHGDANCEKKINSTKMFVVANDPKIICNQKPSAATLDCMVELLTKGKNRLRKPDFFEVYGLCRVDSSRRMRDCVLKKMSRSWDAPDYQSIHIIGDQCAFQLAGVPVRKFPTQQELADEAQARWKRTHSSGASAKRAVPVSEPAPGPGSNSGTPTQ